MMQALGELLPRFAQTMELTAPLGDALTKALDADEPARKRLARAKMLHNVLSTKHPDIKLDDVGKMTAEWLHGALDASYPAESALFDGEFSDSATYDALLRLLDGAHQWVRELVGVYELAGRIQQPPVPQRSGSVSSGGNETDSAAAAQQHVCQPDVADLIQRAFESGAALTEVVPAAAPEAEVLGLELWEALCWRRGALRYYRAAADLRGGGRGREEAAAANAAAARGAAPCAALLEQAVSALQLLLRARGDEAATAAAARQLVWQVPPGLAWRGRQSTAP